MATYEINVAILARGANKRFVEREVLEQVRKLIGSDGELAIDKVTLLRLAPGTPR